MAANSKIEWTETTWNPVTGCTKTSPGCQNCYAERLAKRLKAMGVSNYSSGFKVALHQNSLEKPLDWKKPQTIFVNSMSDLFHEDIPEDFIFDVFKIMKKAAWHHFQILTKRSERLFGLSEKLDWASNIWMGVSVENENYSYRIDHLRNIKAKVKFISFEPLLGYIENLNLNGIDWVIVGGESGPKARTIETSWVIQIRNRCIEESVPFFFKQWGGINKKKTGRKLENQIWNQMPACYSY